MPNEGIELVNGNPYGNGVSLFTSPGGAAGRLQCEVETGQVGINVPIPVPLPVLLVHRLDRLVLRRSA